MEEAAEAVGFVGRVVGWVLGEEGGVADAGADGGGEDGGDGDAREGHEEDLAG